MSKLFTKSRDASLTLTAVIPERFGVTGVNWSQEVAPMRGAPVSPAPLVLSEAAFVGNVASVVVSGGEAGARYVVRTAPGPFRGDEVPGWVKTFRVQVA